MPCTRLLSLLLIAAACRRTGDALAPTPATAPPCRRDAATAPADPATQPSTAAARAIALPTSRQRRERGLVALDAGRFDIARAEFAAIVEVAPGNLAAQALLDAATRALLAARERAAADFAAARPTVVPAPPWHPVVTREVAVAAPTPAPRLVQVTATPSVGTDEAEWFRRHNLRLPEYEVPNPMRGLPGNLPPTLPPAFGQFLLIQAIAHADHTILIYGPSYGHGRFVAVLDARDQRIAFLDFAAYRLAPADVTADPQHVEQGVIWAEVVEGVLYVAHGPRSHARRSNGMTAYLTALDLTTGALRWRSAPGVAGAANFVIRGAHILTGHGFTGASSHLFVLDRRDGKTVVTAALASAPEYLFVRDSALLVRSADADLEFALR